MVRRLIQLIFILIPFGLFGWLLWIDIAPDGEKIITFEMDQISPYVNRLLPDERVLGLQYNEWGEPYTTVIDEPVYFSVTMPHTDFETLDVEIEFANTGQQIVEVGALMDIQSQAFDLRPLQSLLIDGLEWDRVEDDGVALLQRISDYESVDAFLADPPARSEVATYHYDLDTPYRLSSYTPLGHVRTIDASLRGYHQYVTYLKDEPFYLEVEYMDMNRTTGADDGVIRVRNEDDEVMYEYFLYDDGNELENQISDRQTAVIDQSGWPEGVYRVELSGTSDLFWRTITTTQRYVTFINQLYIGDDIGYLADPRATTFYTSAKHLTLETYHSDATQRVTIGSEDVWLPLSHEKVTHTVEDAGVVLGHTPSGDVKITGDGKFAFSSDAFFDPDPISINSFTDIDALGVNYVLTSYESPEVHRRWLKAAGSFDVGDLNSQDGSVTFTFSVPGIQELQETVDVHAINLIFKKEPMSPKEFLHAVRELMPFGL